jgi:hypothetical protein
VQSTACELLPPTALSQYKRLRGERPLRRPVTHRGRAGGDGTRERARRAARSSRHRDVDSGRIPVEHAGFRLPARLADRHQCEHGRDDRADCFAESRSSAAYRMFYRVALRSHTRERAVARLSFSISLSLSFGLLDRRLSDASYDACAQQDIWAIHVSLSPVIYGLFLLARQPITNCLSFSCRSVHICSVSPKKAGAPSGFPTRARSLPTRDPRPAQH